MESRLDTDAIPIALPLQETRTFQAEELSSSEQITELFVALENDDWNSVFQIIENDFKGIINYTGRFLRGYTVLHYAVERDDFKRAEDLIQELLNIAKKDLVKPGQLYHFVNTVNDEGKMAMDIAVCRRQYLVIDFLLDHGAEMKFAQFRKVIKKVRYKRLFEVYDKSIHVHRHNYYYDQSLYWIVHCQFSSITWDKGEYDLENDKYREMMYPSALLTMSNENRGEILMHPLFQIFLWEKWRRLSFTIWISIAMHMLWYALSTTYIVCNTCIDLTTMNGLADSYVCTSFLAYNSFGEPNISVSLIILVMVYLVMLLKELCECFIAPERKYYWSQIENIGQWLILIVLPLTALFPTSSSDFTGIVNIGLSLIVTAGIVTSLFLIQGQFTKVENLGVYNQMMRRSFKKLLMFLTANLPLLIAFVLIFRIMLPSNREFKLEAGLGVSKLFAMMIGELDLGDTIHKNDQLKYEQLFAANILIIVFILIAVVVLQNLLIAITIDDLETLKRKATEEHLSAILETLCILDNVLMSDWMLKMYECLHIKNWVVKKLVLTVHHTGEEYREAKIRFVKLPQRIQISLRKYMRENPQCIVTTSNHHKEDESFNIIKATTSNINKLLSCVNHDNLYS